MAFWSDRLPRRPDPGAARVVEACEWLLAGRYVELCEREGVAVPGWAWVNLLAHGGPRDLVAARHPSATGAVDAPSGAWRQARAFLCSEVLGRTGPDAARLVQLQSQALVPLELQLMAVPGHHACRSPARLADAVLRALRHHDASRR